ncbi:hypothetical protein HK102_013683 [Quaeritorhiza haematococci]|nr:hypothetical protein HK102_013683 [Quaeritorhiza haematococci]
MPIFNLKTASFLLVVLVSIIGMCQTEAAPAPLAAAQKGRHKDASRPGPSRAKCEQNKRLVSNLLNDFFNNRDVSGASKYLHENGTYLQYNPQVPDGTDALIQFVQTLPPTSKYEPGIVLGATLSSARAVYRSWSETVDGCRHFSDCRREHWDVLQEDVPANQTRSGHSMLTESTANIGPQDPNRETTHKELARLTLERILIGKDHSLVPQVFGPSPTYLQHNPLVPDGIDALLGFSNSLPANAAYDRGIAIAEGNFVVLHGRYTNLLGPKPLIGADIFRFENGKVVEHWDVLQEEVPADQTKSGRSMLTPAL